MTATDFLAFCVVELNTPLPYDEVKRLRENDPLMASMIRAWENKERRENERTALICWVIARCNGSKNVKISDFMPPKAATKADTESEIKNNFRRYAATLKRLEREKQTTTNQI